MNIEYRANPSVPNDVLNALFADAWGDSHTTRHFSIVLARSLGYICAYAGDSLVGFVNVAWDGALHAFLLDTTVRRDLQRKGIGSELVRHATDLARSKGAEWLHVDFEPRLAEFYRKCGFRHSEAGLVNLKNPQQQPHSPMAIQRP